MSGYKEILFPCYSQFCYTLRTNLLDAKASIRWSIMKTKFHIHVIIIRILLLLILSTTTEALFFEYPKKVLMEFFQSLNKKKEAKKMTNDYHHIHHHYYPVPINLISEHPVKAPETYELDYLHNKRLRSLGWTESEYKFVPEPEIIVPSSFNDSWSLGYPEKQPWEEKEEFHLNSHQHKVPEISVHVPLHQEIILQQQAPESEGKNYMLSTFLKKIQTVKNVLFNRDKESDKSQDKTVTPVVSNQLNTVNAYVVYFHPTGNKRL